MPRWVLVWRVYALVTVHALVEAAVIAGSMAVWFWPAPWLLTLETSAMLFVALPMIWLRGACWVTNRERHWRRRAGLPRAPSMTRRLVTWTTCGLWRPTARSQWLVIIPPPVLWVARLVWLSWQGDTLAGLLLAVSAALCALAVVAAVVWPPRKERYRGV